MVTENSDSVATPTAKKRAKKQSWEGGYIRNGRKGPTYVIEKRINGDYFKASTRCRTRSAALAELARFEKDPSNYTPGNVGPTPVIITAKLLEEFFDWQVNVRGNTKSWARNTVRCLITWAKDFKDKDLRKVSLVQDVKPALARHATFQHHRVIALKAFYTWLRKEKGLLKHFEDPMPDMRIPRLKARKLTAPKDVPIETVGRVLPFLAEDIRQLAIFLSGTGWHVSEARRFAENGDIRRDPTKKHLAVVVTWHKIKEHHVTGLTHQAHLEAALYLKEHGVFSDSWLAESMHRACKQAGVDFFGLGAMRHSVATWAQETGDSMASISVFLNHSSEKTTREHYVRHSTPRATITTFVPKPVVQLRVVEGGD